MKKIIILLSILGFGFNQDVNPPYYLNHPLFDNNSNQFKFNKYN